MPVDLVTLMQFEDGILSEEDTAIMLAEMVESGEIKTLPNKFQRLANNYVKRGMITADGEVII